VEINSSDIGSVLLALIGPIQFDVGKRYYICNTAVMSEMMAVLGAKMYSILTAIVSCSCFRLIFFFFLSISNVEIYRSF